MTSSQWGLLAGGAVFTGVLVLVAGLSRRGAAERASDAWTYINTSGERAFDEIVEHAGVFVGGVAPVRTEAGMGLINTHGQWLVQPHDAEPVFSAAEGFVGLAQQRDGFARSPSTITSASWPRRVMG